MPTSSLKAKLTYTLLLLLGVLLMLRFAPPGYGPLVLSLAGYTYFGATVAAFAAPGTRFSRWFLAPENKEQLSEARWRIRRRNDLWLAVAFLVVAITQTAVAIGELRGPEFEPGWVSLARDLSMLCLFIVMIGALTQKWREA